MRQITVKEPYRNLRFASEAETPSLRPATQEDEGFLFAVFSASRAREYSCTGWSGSRLDLLLRLQFRAREQSYAERFARLPSGDRTCRATADGMRAIDAI